MDSSEEKKGTEVPEGSSSPSIAPEETPSTQDAYDPYAYPDDSYPYEDSASSSSTTTAPETTAVATTSSGGGAAPPTTTPPAEEEDDDDEGMLRMSFMEHLEELRNRIFKMLYGVGIAFVVSLTFAKPLFLVVVAPAVDALKELGIDPPHLAQITPMEAFNVMWIKLPILTSIFLASPWILYQVWAFIAPGLYKRERRWAAPFVICSAGLFILGGLFAYFVAFRFGLTFLLGIGRGSYVTPLVSVSEYFALFVNVTLGVGLVFELPVLIFFLTLLRVVSPRFLFQHSRYAILGIVILAAVITPTPDIFNLMIFAVPMCLLFFVGLFASYLLVLHREEQRFPWRKVLYPLLVLVVLLAGMVYVAIAKYGYQPVPYWPFLTR
jgi:sec-independent protein translocase protein TatC